MTHPLAYINNPRELLEQLITPGVETTDLEIQVSLI